MKAFLPSVLILAAILTAAALNSAAVAGKAAGWDAQLQQAQVQAQSDDWAAVRGAMTAVHHSWNNSRTYLRITVRHEELDDAESLWCRASVSADEQERADFLADTTELRNQLRLLAETEAFRIGNVF